ncbi:hypothetical protein ACEWY4_028072 [Coilia grayii]|uniref:DNA-directed DNA polymerase n=1 Tax=Coilia grayii TaxID=363190 RepID=A0ABD1IQW0_9TELE
MYFGVLGQDDGKGVYMITKVDEVWHFPQRSDTLFSNYVKTFLQYKQEASGYPAHAVTDDEKKAYIHDYFEKEGIRLDPDKICVNPASSSINKLLLNSLWGRFSMRLPGQFARYVFGHSEDACVRTPNIIIFVGAFTTARARLKLYDIMCLGDRLLYSDTDSLIYVTRDGDWEPELGPYLGDLTHELGDGDYITEFCSGGPKTYGYRTANGAVCMKAKGVTLNTVNSKLIRLETLVDLVTHYISDRSAPKHILARTDNIVRDKKRLSLKNKTAAKRFKVIYNKQVLLTDYSTIPYGY